MSDKLTPPPAGKSIMFRSSVSGLWYYEPEAAGDIDGVKFIGAVGEVVTLSSEPAFDTILEAAIYTQKKIKQEQGQ